jgi:hypothetical protein
MRPPPFKFVRAMEALKDAEQFGRIAHVTPMTE